MSKFIEFECNDVIKFHKDLNKRVNHVDEMFVQIAEKAMENTIKHIETNPKTPVQDGDYVRGWRNDIEPVKRNGRKYSKTTTNNASNEVAKRFNMDEFYAEYIEEGNRNPAPYYEDSEGKVHWHVRPEGLKLLATAELDTDRKLSRIVDDEIKKLLGGLFD